MNGEKEKNNKPEEKPEETDLLEDEPIIITAAEDEDSDKVEKGSKK